MGRTFKREAPVHVAKNNSLYMTPIAIHKADEKLAL